MDMFLCHSAFRQQGGSVSPSEKGIIALLGRQLIVGLIVCNIFIDLVGRDRIIIPEFVRDVAGGPQSFPGKIHHAAHSAGRPGDNLQQFHVCWR